MVKRKRCPILVLFHADWCPHCKDPTFRNAWKRTAAKVPDHVEIESEQLKNLPKQVRNAVQGFPTIAAVHPNGIIKPFEGNVKNSNKVMNFYQQQMKPYNQTGNQNVPAGPNRNTVNNGQNLPSNGMNMGNRASNGTNRSNNRVANNGSYGPPVPFNNRPKQNANRPVNRPLF